MTSIKKIGIAGEGKMGGSLFHYLREFDLEIFWLASKEGDVNGLQKNTEKKLKRLLDNGLVDAETYRRKSFSFQISTDASILEGCDLIIEAINEDEDRKRQLFKKLDKICHPGCIFASNSSSILPGKLIPSNDRAGKFIGLHFFYPVALKNLSEVIPARETSPTTVDAVREFLSFIKRFHFIQQEENAFMMNRIFLDFQAEAFHIQKDTVPEYSHIDSIVKEYFFPVGVFEFIDSVGIDVMLPAVINYSAMASDPTKYEAMIRSMKAMISHGRFGKKRGGGYYDQCNAAENDEKTQLYPHFLHYKGIIHDKLKNCLIESVNHFLIHKACSREELEYAIKEYMGVEELPFL